MSSNVQLDVKNLRNQSQTMAHITYTLETFQHKYVKLCVNVLAN